MFSTLVKVSRGPRYSPMGDARFLLIHITLGRDSSVGAFSYLDSNVHREKAVQALAMSKIWVPIQKNNQTQNHPSKSPKELSSPHLPHLQSSHRGRSLY